MSSDFSWPERSDAQARHRDRTDQRGQVYGQAERSAVPGLEAFLRNHADGIAAMDLFVVPTISFRLLYGLLIMGHGRRKDLWFGITAHPTAEWIANQITQACGCWHAPKQLIFGGRTMRTAAGLILSGRNRHLCRWRSMGEDANSARQSSTECDARSHCRRGPRSHNSPRSRYRSQPCKGSRPAGPASRSGATGKSHLQQSARRRSKKVSVR